MSEGRAIRLSALALLLACALGLVGTFVGWVGEAEGTAVFPIGLIIAALTLHANRPREPRKPRTEARGNRAKG